MVLNDEGEATNAEKWAATSLSVSGNLFRDDLDAILVKLHDTVRVGTVGRRHRKKSEVALRSM